MVTKASLVARSVKSLPAMQETWVRSLGRKDPLEREWQPAPAFLPGEFHEQRNLAGYTQFMGSQKVRHEFLLTVMTLNADSERLN